MFFRGGSCPPGGKPNAQLPAEASTKIWMQPPASCQQIGIKLSSSQYLSQPVLCPSKFGLNVSHPDSTKANDFRIFRVDEMRRRSNCVLMAQWPTSVNCLVHHSLRQILQRQPASRVVKHVSMSSSFHLKWPRFANDNELDTGIGAKVLSCCRLHKALAAWVDHIWTNQSSFEKFWLHGSRCECSVGLESFACFPPPKSQALFNRNINALYTCYIYYGSIFSQRIQSEREHRVGVLQQLSCAAMCCAVVVLVRIDPSASTVQ